MVSSSHYSYHPNNALRDSLWYGFTAVKYSREFLGKSFQQGNLQPHFDTYLHLFSLLFATNWPVNSVFSSIHSQSVPGEEIKSNAMVSQLSLSNGV